jgi:hypothetical protein
MLICWKKLKKAAKTLIWKDSFYRDLVTLTVLSVFVGSLLASGVSLSANSYFSRTLSNLVGNYGEYDLIIQSREELKNDTARQIQKIINEAFPGARMKEGPTITGKTTFFVALPDKYKTQKIYDSIGKIFGSIPGGAGEGVITDPRLTIEGVPEGAKKLLMDRIAHMDGVRFVFHDGGNIGVIIKSLDQSAAVKQQINELLKQYQVIEIGFPVGSEPADPVRLGKNIAAALKKDLKLNYATDASVAGSNDDMTSMVSTMMELRKFLSAYASKVTIKPPKGVTLVQGDRVAFPGAKSTAGGGRAVEKSDILVEITTLNRDGTAKGIITQGDGADLGNAPGYKVINNRLAAAVGTASCRDPRKDLSSALTQAGTLVKGIPGFAQDTQNVADVAAGALANYNKGILSLEQTLTSVQKAGNTLESTSKSLGTLNMAGLETQVDGSDRAIGNLLNTLRLLKLVNVDVGGTMNTLLGAQSSLESLRSGLSVMDSLTGEANEAKAEVDSVVENGQNTLGILKSFDTQTAQKNLDDANKRLAQAAQVNVPLLESQLQYMAAAAPNLKDDEINRSVQLLSHFIAGQVIPGERIQILTTSDVGVNAAAPVVYQEVGNKNVSLYSTAVGIIDPNPRVELAEVLKEVKGVLAGMTSIIVTLFLLVLDHTAIMAILRSKRLADKKQYRGWRKWFRKLGGCFTAPERSYGMAMGALLLTAMFVLAKGQIPYLPMAGLPFLGALIGWIVAGYAEKISPISKEEIMAGESLGMSLDEIMREIVIPAGRPGLLQKLNARKLKFR